MRTSSQCIFQRSNSVCIFRYSCIHINPKLSYKLLLAPPTLAVQDYSPTLSTLSILNYFQLGFTLFRFWKQIPVYIHQMCYVYNLRNVSSTLCLPQPRTNNLKKSFMYDGSFLWNSIAKEIKESKSLSSFRTKIAAHIDN
jgi:hypothetical protein